MIAKSSNVSSTVLGLAAAGLLGLVGYGVVRSQVFDPSLLSTGRGNLEILEPTQSFTISADPTFEVLRVRIYGGLQSESYTYTMFGDGRLVKERLLGQREPDIKETALSFIEMQDLLGIAVGGDLMEWDWSRIEQKIIGQRGRVPSFSDSRTVDIRISLDTYSGAPSGQTEQPYEKTISSGSPAMLYRKVPEVREIAAMYELLQRLAAYF